MSRVPPVTASPTLLLTLFLVADPAAGPAAAQQTSPEEFRFQGLDWTATAEQVRTHLTGVGFAYRDGLSDSEDLVFVGARRMGYPAVVIARMHEGELAKVALLLAARSAERLIPDYRAVVDSLRARHGAPTETMEVYEAPYRKGDGFAITALRDDKAHVLTYWDRPGGALGVRPTEQGLVKIDYEGPDWAAAVASRESTDATGS